MRGKVLLRLGRMGKRILHKAIFDIRRQALRGRPLFGKEGTIAESKALYLPG